LTGLLLSAPGALAKAPSDSVRQIRTIETAAADAPSPEGLSYSGRSGNFLILEKRDENSLPVSRVSSLSGASEKVREKFFLEAEVLDPINVAFDEKAQRLLIFNKDSGKFTVVPADAEGRLRPGKMWQQLGDPFDVQDPQGMSVDPSSGEIFILDGHGPRIVSIQSSRGFRKARVSSIDLSGAGLGEVRGIAFDPSSGHFQILNPVNLHLYEVTREGQVMVNRDLSGVGLVDPQAMVFAPSGDQTDDASTTTLYIADSGGEQGGLVEVSLAGTVQALATFVSTLVQTIDSSAFSPPSPDTSGAAYVSTTGTLFLADSEVNEIPALFTGDNLFEIDLNGNLLDLFTTIDFSDEPTGIAYNPVNKHFYISDDVKKRVHELSPGPDGLYNTGDDVVTGFNTDSFGGNDPEGITYNTWNGFLYIVDGVNNEVYEVSPGSNGIFDGVPPAGDDGVTSFDVSALGVLDPEGITFGTDNGFLYVVGRSTKTTLSIMTTTGTLVQTMDISAANARTPSGLAYGPSSINPSVMNIYMTSRGVDNGSDPNENDGRVYELTAPNLTSDNSPPTVNAGPDQSITLPDGAVLNGTVTDDNIPAVPTVTWSQVGGPAGAVTFDNANAEDTTAHFAAVGNYVLRLTAFDGELVGIDELTVTVAGSAGQQFIDSRVSATSDDAEEAAGGAVSLGSSDLELLLDGDHQTVGVRFSNITLSQCSSVTSAHVQFQADEADSVATSILIQGQKAANAGTFVNSSGNISSRPRTAASVPWSPAPWGVIGQAGIDQQTPDISSIIQEIVNQPTWASGNSMALIFTGTGRRTAESFDGVPAAAPLLHIESIAGNGTPAVSIQSPADGTSVNAGTSISFSGSASDCPEGDLSSGLVWNSSLDGDLNGGAPAASFSTSGLSVGTHSITASVTDGDGLMGQSSITVTIVSAGEPVGPVTDINGALDQVLETATVGTAVGITAQAIDTTGTDTVSYAFTNNSQTTTDGLFTIDSSTGVITVAAALDYETATSHPVPVRATSTDTSTSEATFNIAVLNVNEPVGPVTDINGVPNQVLETATPGTAVGITAQAVDPDAGSSVSYSFTNGSQTTTDGLFAIDSSTGVITVAGALDFGVATSHSVPVRATSTDTSTSEATFNIAVLDVNDPVGPVTDINGALNQVLETAIPGTAVGITASAIDPTGTDTVSYAFTNGSQTSPGGLFSINSSTGVITVAGVLDYETATSHSVSVRATSSDTTTSQATFIITVLPVNEPIGPVTDANGALNQVLETATPGTAVGITAQAVDPDAGSSVSYSFTNNSQTTTDGLFAIDSSTGVITVAGALDYETATSHSVPVRATSSDTSTSEATFNIAVLDVNEGGSTTTEVRVSAGSDDAEESPNGRVSLGSSDLELLLEGRDRYQCSCSVPGG